MVTAAKIRQQTAYAASGAPMAVVVKDVRLIASLAGRVLVVRDLYPENGEVKVEVAFSDSE